MVQSVTTGDRITVDRHRVGDAPREGVIVEVIGPPDNRRFHVRWDDGSESVVSPGGDAHVEHVLLPARSSGADSCTRALVEAGVGFELVPHTASDSAAAEARSLGVPLDVVAKTVVLVSGGVNLRAVVRASDRLSVRKVREILDEPGDVRLATESELRQSYPMFELGAIPPFGGPAGEVVLVDRRVAALGRTFIEAGERDLSLQMRSDDLVSVTGARVANLIED
jgi:Ala-tRNA(Pro) deacylase